MKKSILNLVTASAALTLMASSLQIQAKEGDMFAGVMINHGMYENDGADELALSAFTLRYNYEFLDNQMFETRFSQSFADHTSNEVDYKLNSLFGVYYSYNYELTKSIAVYGLVGLSQIEVQKTVYDIAMEDDEVLPSYGAGFTFKLGKDANLNIEGVMYGDDDVKYAAAGLGLELFF
ncbi:porin family protein [Thalassomonas sp. M1454]|uniref:porin family protein n=1 Tax=Thalassomonas sp. M1454 TaxID=2594477 RepID=UPI00117CDCB3|nr:porin family protein [Thalassomonas sp. M1454]TRX57158.1 porin family protein [Thalassomonas sp. M1454]